MDFEQFKFVYQDLKQQLREIPSLPLLLKSIEKTTRKLDCINLYSTCDRKEFDLQLFQRDTFNELAELMKQLSGIRLPKGRANYHQSPISDLSRRIQKIKESKMQAFDKLDRMQQALTAELELLVDENELDSPQAMQNQIKEVEQDEQEGIQPQNKQGSRVQALKREIDELNKKISKLNRGKGRWFDGDHADFIKIYNRCSGDAHKILEEGMKILGMKNTQITDHLQVYENYLQFEKQKRLATQQFKSIRMLEEQLKKEQKLHGQSLKEAAAKQKKRLIEQQNLKKKQMIQQFRRKKAEQQQKLLRQAERSKEAVKNSKKVSVDKKKQIEQRNKRLIQQKQEQFKRSSNSAAKPAPLLPKPPIIKSIPIPLPKKGI